MRESKPRLYKSAMIADTTQKRRATTKDTGNGAHEGASDALVG